MIPVNRETMLTVAIIACVIGLLYLFKELNRTKEEMGTFKNFSAQVVRRLKPPEPEQVQETVKKVEPEKEEVEEGKTEE